MKKQTATPALATVLAVIVLLQSGCSKTAPPELKESVSSIRSDLTKADRARNPQIRISLLRRAYDDFAHVQATWPDSKQAQALLAKHGGQLSRIPEAVYGLSIAAKDLDSFKWALARSAKVNTYYTEFLKFWECGPAWRDFLISTYPDEALPLFMNRAIETGNVKFFDQYVDAFKASGFKVGIPLETTEFNVRFCRFLAEALERAMKKTDPDRIGFLLDHTPPLASVVYIDWKTEKTMRELGDYICKDLMDEALALKLIALGYELNRIDPAAAGFSSAFTTALAEDPDYAIRVLELGKWHGALSEPEANIIRTLPNPSLEAVDLLLIDEAIEFCIKNAYTGDAIRLIRFREGASPLTRHDYDELLTWATKYANDGILDYVTEECDYMGRFGIEFIQMAGNPALFAKLAPPILERIHPTMDKHALDNDITFGVVYELLASKNHPAGLFIVQHYDWGEAWTQATGGRTLLMAVCEGGNLEAAKYLIEKKGAAIHARTDYIEHQTTVFGSTKSAEGKLTPIFFAASSGNCALIQYLIDQGADVNDRSNYGATPLMFAVSAGQLDATKLLLARGANVHAEMSAGFNQASLGGIGAYSEISTAYKRARANRHVAIQNILTAAGATL